MDICDTQWIESEYVSKVRLNDPYEPFTDDSPLSKFEHVELNLRDSRSCARDFQYPDPTSHGYRGFDNVIANIRNLFPTDRISSKEFNIFTHDAGIALNVFSNLRKIVQLGNREHLTVNFQFFIGYNDSKCSEIISDKEAEIPAEYILLNHHSIFYHREFPSKNVEGQDKLRRMKWICKRFRIQEIENKEFQFNVNVFLPVEVFGFEIADTRTKSFIKIFEEFN
uniref:Uncharacterized protein n=1 Tax=Caenorhabditis tropicalis TaxID=1561998 RepID=A0A1I7UX39_9PELO